MPYFIESESKCGKSRHRESAAGSGSPQGVCGFFAERDQHSTTAVAESALFHREVVWEVEA